METVKAPDFLKHIPELTPMKPHHLILAAALASVTLAWGQATKAPQSWTSTDGRTIQARFV